MDPNQTFLDMFAAMRDKDVKLARELAIALKSWFEKGGFYPHQYTPEAMHAYIASVLRRTAGHRPEPVCSLVCRNCDAGEGIPSEEQAIEEGWSEIELALDLPQANFCGLCPDCQRRDAEEAKR